MEYTIKVEIKTNGSWADKSQYVQLPITLKEVLDETLDVGEIVLNFTPDAEEYEAFSDVLITVLGNQGFEKSYLMMVQKDLVEEQQIGVNSYYKHSIVLIEGTHRLSTVILNDFSITQPVDAISLKAEWTPSVSLGANNRQFRYFLLNSKTSAVTPSGYDRLLNYVGPWQQREYYLGASGTDDSTAIKMSKAQNLPGYNAYSRPIFGLGGFSNIQPSSDISEYYTVEDFIIQLPELPEPTFFISVGTAVVGLPANMNFANLETFEGVSVRTGIGAGDAVLLGQNGAARLTGFKINVVEKLLDVTDPNNIVDKSSLLNETRKIRRSELDFNHTYRYVIRSSRKDVDGVAFWENAENQARYSQSLPNISYNGISLYEPPTVQQVLSSTSYQLGLPAGGTITKTADADPNSTLFEYYYEFQVVTSIPENRAFSIDDAITKAINHIEPRKLLESRYYKSIPQPPSYDQLVPNPSGTLEFADNPDKYIVGLKENLPYGYKIAIPYDIGGLPIGRRYYEISSKIDDELVDYDIYDPEFSSFMYYTRRQKYYLDPIVKNKIAFIPSLDFAFTGGKTLLEVLFQLGKVFGGIPRLKLDADRRYVISFDILEDLQDNPNFSDSTNLESKESNSDNYATSLISQVENAMSDDEDSNREIASSFYPSSSAWAKVRTQDYNDTILSLIDQSTNENLALVIDDSNHGIYKVLSLKVRNFGPAYLPISGANYTNGLDITKYVMEKTAYETLPTSFNGKGKRIYYEKDKNAIESMFKIFDPDNAAGFEGTKRVIEEVIKAATGSYPTGALLDLEFRLEYVPTMVKGRIVSEQSNVVKENQDIANAYSQEERNISLAQFGRAADNILKRTGLNNIQKTYMLTELNQMPFLGEKITKDGFDYFADNVALILDNNHAKVAVSYSKTTNKIDKFVGFNKHFREYSIFKDDIVWKRMNLSNYVYVDTRQYTDNDFLEDEFLLGKRSKIPNSFRDLFNQSESIQKLESAVFYPKDLNTGLVAKYGTDSDFDGVIDTYTDLAPFISKLVGSYSNNSLIFTASTYDNYSAGRKITQVTDTNNNVNPNRKSQTDVPYCDHNGRLDVMMVSMIPSEYSTSDSTIYPEILPSDWPVKRQQSYFDEIIFVNKDNKDAIQLIYQIHAISRNKDIQLRPGLMKFNKMVVKPSSQGRLIAVGVQNLSAIKNSRVFDYDNSDILVSSYSPTSFNETTRHFTIPAVSFTSTKQYAGYAWVYENSGDIAMIHSFPISVGSNTTPEIFFNFRDSKYVPGVS